MYRKIVLFCEVQKVVSFLGVGGILPNFEYKFRKRGPPDTRNVKQNLQPFVFFCLHSIRWSELLGGCMTKTTEKKDVESLFQFCTQNSFGSVSKQELEIFLFGLFKEWGLIEGDNSWEIACSLKISKSKAQKYLYETELRHAKINDTKDKLKKILDIAPTIENSDTLSIVIDSHYMRDFVRNELTKGKYFSDRSFASDVVKMSVEGYLFLLEKYNSEQYKKFNREEFIKVLKEIPSDFLGKHISEIFGESAGIMVEKGVGFLLKRFINSRKTGAII